MPPNPAQLDGQAREELKRERLRHAQGVADCSGLQGLDSDRLVAESRLHLHNVDQILKSFAKRQSPIPTTPPVPEFERYSQSPGF